MRVLENHSVREITDRKTEIGTELRASLYFYKDEKYIVCSISGIAEYGEPVILEDSASDSDLGLALCDMLLAFQASGSELSSGKLEDWAAYRASGAKSGNAFEKNAIYVYVRTVNTAINIEAAPRVSPEKQLKALCSISNGLPHSEIGRAVKKAIKAASALRQAGML